MAPVKRLADPVRIGSVTTKNRICIPPMVYYHHAGPDGLVTEDHVDHFRAFAEGGAGLIIQEATAVLPEGRISGDQLGIWSDDQIPGLRRITGTVHESRCPIFVQLHHGGIMATQGERVCPSAYSFQRPSNGGEMETVTGRTLTREEIHGIRDAFIQGARRAEQAGYDGVELHGCHSYLLCQFLNRNVNRRTDEYGDPMVLIREIYQGIRAVTGPDFVVGIRLGGFEPTLADGIAHAKTLETMGMDFLDISFGFSQEMDLTAPGNPDFSAPVRAAAAIRAETKLPVFAVNSIFTPAQAEKILLETDVDIVDIGRSALVDPNWPREALAGQETGTCRSCRACQWRIDEKKCPGRILWNRRTQ